jgi:hypothetical protein
MPDPFGARCLLQWAVVPAPRKSTCCQYACSQAVGISSSVCRAHADRWHPLSRCHRRGAQSSDDLFLANQRSVAALATAARRARRCDRCGGRRRHLPGERQSTRHSPLRRHGPLARTTTGWTGRQRRGTSLLQADHRVRRSPRCLCFKQRSTRYGHPAQQEGRKYLVGDAHISRARIGGHPRRLPFARSAL